MQEPSLMELCRLEPAQVDRLDEARRVLQETFCGAVLWLDGVLGGDADVESARSTSGRIEATTLYSEYHGLEPGARLRLRYDLPNLSRRVNIFLGRGDRTELVEDREEGLALRSSTLGRTGEEAWLTGLGYRPPGRLGRTAEVRAGVRVRPSLDPFSQVRLRRSFLLSDVSIWRFRQTFFWESDEGFGSTTAVEYDRVLAPDVLAHWSNRGTVSERSEGLSWVTVGILYHGLGEGRAVAAEGFVRGATSAEVPLQEYGLRGIYRQQVLRPYLFAELILGYSWPRYERDVARTGSPMTGLGAEIHFGRTP